MLQERPDGQPWLHMVVLRDGSCVLSQLRKSEQARAHLHSSYATLLFDLGRTNLGESPLYGAIKRADVEQMKLLIDYRADVNKTTNEGDSPVSLACRRGLVNCLELLIGSSAVRRERTHILTPPTARFERIFAMHSELSATVVHGHKCAGSSLMPQDVDQCNRSGEVCKAPNFSCGRQQPIHLPTARVCMIACAEPSAYCVSEQRERLP